MSSLFARLALGLALLLGAVLPARALLRRRPGAAIRVRECRLGLTPLPPGPAIPDGLAHMLPQFVAEMDKDAVTLQSLAEAPAAALAEHAHAMRGKCAMFGEDILFQLLTRLEQEVLAGLRDGIPALIALVVERADQLRIYEAGFPPVPQP